MTALQNFRQQKDHFFAHHPQSPLTDDQKLIFSGLRYFPENPQLRYEVKVEEFAPKEKISLPTSTGDSLTYERFGRIHFEVDGEPAQLTIYARDNDFFLPFVDSLAGKETYGAGRYVEVHPVENGRLLVDFNYAYNPYCAYNDNWSCPVTLAENRLKVPILAGEKIYAQHSEENNE